MARSLRFNCTSNADIFFLDKVSVESSEESCASGRKLHVTAFHSYLKKATFDSTRTPQKNRAMDSRGRFYSTQNLSPHKSWHLRKVATFTLSKPAESYVHLKMKQHLVCTISIYYVSTGETLASRLQWQDGNKTKKTPSNFNRHRIPYSEVPTTRPDLGTQGWGQRFKCTRVTVRPLCVHYGETGKRYTDCKVCIYIMYKDTVPTTDHQLRIRLERVVTHY